MKHIGNEIDRILKERRIKKKDFAESIGTTDVNLSKILKKKSIDTELLYNIAQKLNIPAGYFLDDNGNNTATGALNAAGNGNTISGNNIKGSININLPPPGYQTVINSEGYIKILPATAPEVSAENEILKKNIADMYTRAMELSDMVIELQRQLITKNQ